MDQSYESLMSASEFRPMVISPHMSPQLNETICGCRCGCGCGCAGHGDGDGDGDEYERMSEGETAINSTDSDSDEGFATVQQAYQEGFESERPDHSAHGILSSRALPHQVVGWLLSGPEELQTGESLIHWQQVSVRSPLYGHRENAAESLLNGALSAENRSRTVSSRDSVQMGSPGPGIGAWLIPERMWSESIQRVYIITPLRLSAEHQHARGKAAEHLLLPDEASVHNFV